MKIVEVQKRSLNDRYIEERDLVWEAKRIECTKIKQPLWNGALYYLDHQDGSDLYIGLCEYKDLVFLEEKGNEYIINKYGKGHVLTYLNVQVLINFKDTYLFGTKKTGNIKEIISVGGTLRLEDGKKIQNLEDILEYAKKEVDIETKLSVNVDQLKFLEFVINENIGTFVFTYELKSKPYLQILNIGEFDGEVYLQQKDVYSSDDHMPNIRLKSLKNYLHDLWKIK